LDVAPDQEYIVETETETAPDGNDLALL